MLGFLLIGSALAATGDCAPGPGPGPRTLVLRGHTYRRIGACHGVPVYRTRSTDSTFADRESAAFPVVLVTRESVDPDSSGGDWPAPPGNVYLSVVVALPAQPARDALTESVDGVLAALAPGLATTSSWDGDYGAHRGPDGRFLSGLLSGNTADGTALGVDLHLRATARAYRRLGADSDHVSLTALGIRTPTVSDITWQLLRSLPPPKP